MIDGTDSVIPWRRNLDTQIVLDRIRDTWPEMAIEKDPPNEKEIYEVAFVFRDESARQKWRLEGGTPENQVTMINVFREPTRLTLVGLDSPELRQIVSDLRGTASHHLASRKMT